jgi:hypothetical protein
MQEKEYVVSIYDKEQCKIQYKLVIPKEKVTLAALLRAMKTIDRIYTGNG